MVIALSSLALSAGVGPLLGGWVFDRSSAYQPAVALAALPRHRAMALIWLAAPRRGKLGASPPGTVGAYGERRAAR
jgi:hypothetical protein